MQTPTASPSIAIVARNRFTTASTRVTDEAGLGEVR